MARNPLLQFRAEPQLAEAVARAAEQAGLTVPEWLRVVAADAVGKPSPVAAGKPPTTGKPERTLTPRRTATREKATRVEKAPPDHATLIARGAPLTLGEPNRARPLRNPGECRHPTPVGGYCAACGSDVKGVRAR